MSHDQAVYTQEVCEGIRTEYEEQSTLQQQQEQQQEQLTAAEAQHSTALAQLAALRLTALHGMPDKLLEQVCSSQAVAQHLGHSTTFGSHMLLWQEANSL